MPEFKQHCPIFKQTLPNPTASVQNVSILGLFKFIWGHCPNQSPVKPMTSSLWLQWALNWHLRKCPFSQTAIPGHPRAACAWCWNVRTPDNLSGKKPHFHPLKAWLRKPHTPHFSWCVCSTLGKHGCCKMRGAGLQRSGVGLLWCGISPAAVRACTADFSFNTWELLPGTANV